MPAHVPLQYNLGERQNMTAMGWYVLVGKCQVDIAKPAKSGQSLARFKTLLFGSGMQGVEPGPLKDDCLLGSLQISVS